MTTTAAPGRLATRRGSPSTATASGPIAAARGRQSPSRAALLVAPFIALVVGIWAMGPFPVGVMSDDAMYVILAKSLATGQGYRYLNLPGAPAATHFPPGYPALLAVLWRLGPAFPRNVLLFKLTNACLLAVIAAWSARFVRVRDGFSTRGATLFALGVVLSIPMITLSALVMSELLFLALLLPTLMLAERIADDDAGIGRSVLLGALTGVVTLVRSLGVAAIGAAVIGLFLRGRRRAALVSAATSALIVAPWQLWTRAHSGAVPAAMREAYESYDTWLVDSFRTEGIGLLGRTLVRTSEQSAATLAMLIAPFMSHVTRMLAVTLLVIICAVGARRLWWDAPVSALFLAAYAAIVLAWPVLPMRFIFGVWPFVTVAAVLGTRELLRWRPASVPYATARVGLLAGASLLAVGFGTYNVFGYHLRSWEYVPRENGVWLRSIINGTRAHIPPGTVVAATAEGATYLYTGRMSVPAYGLSAAEFFRNRTTAESVAALQEILASYRVDRVVASNATTLDAARALSRAHPPRLVVSDSFPGSLVYRPLR